MNFLISSQISLSKQIQLQNKQTYAVFENETKKRWNTSLTIVNQQKKKKTRCDNKEYFINFFLSQLRRILNPRLIITKKINTGTCCAQVAVEKRREELKCVFFLFISNFTFSRRAACKPPKVCHHRCWQMNKITSTPLDYYY